MIPRYAPTYTLSDLFHSIWDSRRKECELDLINRLADLYQVKHIFLLKSARVGLYTILKAYNRPGSVLLPAYNCIVVPEAVHYAGYQPRFVDIDPATLNVSPEALENAITPDTTVVFATHLFGIPCDLEKILHIVADRNLLVVEDAAPALGATYGGKLVGSFGDAAVISFQSTKVISGEVGGALLVNNDDLASKIAQLYSDIRLTANTWFTFGKSFVYKIALIPLTYSLLRNGYRLVHKEQMYEVISAELNLPKGYFSQMPEYGCALVLRQLERLNWNLRRRRQLAKIYKDNLSGHPSLKIPEIPELASPSWIQYPLICDQKQRFYKFMQSEGVDVSWTYKYSCAESFNYSNFPNTHNAANKVISLPTTPFITDEQAYQICQKVLKFTSE